MNPYNLARFDLVTIRLVVDCARLGSLSAAAEQSHLALAAASRRIRDLEDTLGQQLFERHGRGLHASPAARVFVRHALPMLQSVDRLGGELNDLRRGIARRIRLSASTAAINQFLAPLLAAYDAKAPQVQVELHEQLSSRVISDLREGLADVGIFVEGPETANLDCRLFRHDELVVLMPPGHRLAGRSPMDFEEALGEDWISLEGGAALLEKQLQAAHAAGAQLRCRLPPGGRRPGRGPAAQSRSPALGCRHEVVLARLDQPLGPKAAADGHAQRHAGAGGARSAFVFGPGFAKHETSTPKTAIDTPARQRHTGAS
jgi:DNA-binding transcriptional LysR family regulator